MIGPEVGINGEDGGVDGLGVDGVEGKGFGIGVRGEGVGTGVGVG